MAQETNETKYQTRGFTPASAVGEGEPEPSQEELQAAAEAIDAGAPQEESFQDMNLGESVEEPQAEEEDSTRTGSAEPEEEIEIGDRKFRTQKEAFEYARELEREKLANDAFSQGIEAARRTQESNSPQGAQEPAKPAELPMEYYTDPAGYWAKREQELLDRAAQKVNAQLTAQERNKQVWTEFYNDYPDLSKSTRIVQSILNEDWATLQHVETKRALKMIADKARKEIEIMTEDRIPKKDLPAGKNAVSSGTQKGVTQGKSVSQEKNLNFVEQSKTLRTAAGKAAARKRLGM